MLQDSAAYGRRPNARFYPTAIAFRGLGSPTLTARVADPNGIAGLFQETHAPGLCCLGSPTLQQLAAQFAAYL